jgi:carboxymethylenebutenolidase
MRSNQPSVGVASFAFRHLLPIRFLIGLVAFVMLAAPAAAAVTTSTKTFLAGDRPIEIDRYDPGTDGKHAAVVLLHGSEGLKDFGRFYRQQAQILAEEGYVVFLVHYFDRTGTTRVEPGDVKEDNFMPWLDTVRQAVRYVAEQRGVDATRVGLVGVSLGAYLALAAAAPGDLPIAAVVDLFGGLHKKFRKDVKKLPPTLIIHGDADKVVPVEEAYALEEVLKTHEVVYEIKVYEGQQHVFRTAPLGTAACHARRLALAFLARHLKDVDLAARK